MSKKSTNKKQSKTATNKVESAPVLTIDTPAPDVTPAPEVTPAPPVTLSTDNNAFQSAYDSMLKVRHPRQYDALKDLTAPNYEANINALSKDMLSVVTVGALMIQHFAESVNPLSSPKLQSLFKEYTGKNILLGFPRFAESPLHFGAHKNCKIFDVISGNNEYKVIDGKQVDTVCTNCFGVFPLVYKGGKIFTQTESGYYYPNPNVDYKGLLKAIGKNKIQLLCKTFYSKCITEVRRNLIEKATIK